MKRVIIVGSPRSNGRSAHLAETLFEAHIDEHPEDELFLVPVSEIEVGPCIGCNACRKLTEAVQQVEGDDGREVHRLLPRCVFDDDMQTLYDLLDDADELTLVSPVYFSGAPGLLKCLLDRLQPYFWANIATGWKGSDEVEGGSAADAPVEPWRPRRNRPATLHVLGEGGDPHGFDPLASEVKSSIACAGFRLERIFDWVGKVTPEGEIVAEADEIELVASGAAQGDKGEIAAPSECERSKGSVKKPDGKGARPKLDFSQGKKGGSGKKASKSKKGGSRGK